MPEEVWSSRFMSSLWSETSETWEDTHEDWRIVGTNPFNRRNVCEKPKIEEDFLLYVVEFPSKRLDIAYNISNEKIQKNVYVILEADRGEDCGIIKGYTTRDCWEDFLRRYKNIDNDFKLKRIYRVANEEDLKVNQQRKEMVAYAIEECKKHVEEMSLKMTVLDCEYQFDLNKVTFFYKSEERIDFRGLVKDLYKVFKTRIWMCSVDKSVDKMLIEVLKE
ncbi:uncharacterized protein VICG_01177 [Vittaforma corneae ATCC 50505]|uniref:PSP1 C-terminal domain-containing protein n=1 Tax=Vittaforma corneae (strain ATCC 50505) TaxID=993615 RepID=L2GMU3_VITCO|nr:uncharacterized protein VICG_01177 [Vittaforma corneae ATCC 50505]ELA41825.1 hypothetical protein VICG_01177 [Vittaforma corneae ATCC 50505]